MICINDLLILLMINYTICNLVRKENHLDSKIAISSSFYLATKLCACLVMFLSASMIAF